MQSRNRNKAMISIAAVAAVHLMLASAGYSQSIPPLPRDTSLAVLPPATAWAEGKTMSGEDKLNPFDKAAGKILITMNFNPRILGYIGANKGAGLEEADAGTFSLRSLAFPDASNAAFLAKLQFSVGKKTEGTTGSHRFPVFADYAFQRRTVKAAEGEDEENSRSFETSTFHVGAGYTFTSLNTSSPFRCTGVLSFVSLQITDATVADYRDIVDDPEVADRMIGAALKIALQYNDFGFEFGYVDLRGRHNPKVPGLTGGQFNMAFTANAKLFDLGKKEK